MAGHSKWENIKRRKGAVDAKRSKKFSEISRLIRAAVKEGGSGDPDQNVSLRPLMDKARAANMPKDNIQRAIDRGLGKSKDGKAYEEVIYEGYGPGGVGVLAVSVTDNRNRTGSEVRFAFDKHGGSLGGPGSAMYMFSQQADGAYSATIPAMGVADADVEKVHKLIEALDANDDVESVYTNLPETEE